MKRLPFVIILVLLFLITSLLVIYIFLRPEVDITDESSDETSGTESTDNEHLEANSEDTINSLTGEEEMVMENKFEDFGLSLHLPKEWTVSAEIETDEVFGPYTQITFNIIPPEGIPSGWSFWGSLRIKVYETKESIDHWIKTYIPQYENDINVQTVNSIDGKPTFRLTHKEEGVLWSTLMVVLGNDHSYSFGMSQDGVSGFSERINDEVLPNLKIK